MTGQREAPRDLMAALRRSIDDARSDRVEREALDAATDALAYPSPVTDAHERRAAAALAAGAPFLVRAAVDQALAEVERRIEAGPERYRISGKPESVSPYFEGWDDGMNNAAGAVAAYRRGQAER